MVFINFIQRFKKTSSSKKVNINPHTKDINLKTEYLSIEDVPIEENVSIKEISPPIDVSCPVVHRKILFKVPKSMITYPTLKSRTLNTVLDNWVIKDFQIEDSLDRKTTSIKNPCDDDLHPIEGEYFLDNQYVSCSVSYFGFLVGEGNVVYAMEEDFLTIFPFLYCGYELVPNPIIYDFEVILTTPDATLNPICETEEYFIYEMNIDVSISLLPLIYIPPYFVKSINIRLGKPIDNDKFTHGELASVDLFYFYLDIRFTSPKSEYIDFCDILKYCINLNYLSIAFYCYYFICDEIFNLINLKSLNLSYNKMGSLSSNIGNLTNLTQLNISYNIISSLPIELFNLLKLEILDLSNNVITTLPPDIDNLSNLQGLYLSRNKLSTLPPNIGDLSQLQSLSFFNNEILSLPSEIGNLSKLLFLTGYNNLITDIPSEIGNLSNLNALDLGSNKLSNIPKELGNLSNLRLLNLSSNMLTSLPSELGNLSNLFSLNLQYNSLVSLPSELASLKNLRIIKLSDNKISNLSAFKNTSIILLATNQIVDLPPLEKTNSRYELNLNFLRDSNDTLPYVYTYDGSDLNLETINGELFAIWDSSLSGNDVGFIFYSSDNFNGFVRLKLI